jgi:hypothetical protein
MTQELKKYLNHPIVIETYRNYNSLWEKRQNSPYLNYFGINFDSQGICSFKIYFAFFDRLIEKEVALFLPETTDFFRYYHLWEPTSVKTLEHSGCTFEIKFKGSLDPILGFHYRLKPIKESYDLIGYPENIPFDVLSLNTRPGINYEYFSDSVLRKKYYYFDSDFHKAYFAKRFNNDFLSKVGLIEYTESDKFSKINAWKFDFTKDNMNRPNPFNEKANAIIDFLKEKYGLINISDGYYESSDIRASYYFNIHKTSIAPFDDKENLHIDTLKLFL